MNKRRCNGDGTFTKLKSGTWRVQFMDGYHEDGKRKIISLSAPTKGEARQKMIIYLSAKEEGAVYLGEEANFAEWAALWYADYRSEVKPSTYSNYKYTLNTLVAQFGKRPLAQIRQMEINRFLNDLSAKGFSNSKISKCKAMLIQIFNSAEANDLITRNPALHAKIANGKQRMILDSETEKDAFTEAEVSGMIDHLPDNLLGNSILLLIGSGMRVQELLALEKNDIAEDGSTIRITKAIETVNGMPQLGPPKSKRSRRTIPIPEDFRFFARRIRELGGGEHIWESSRESKLYSVGTFRRRYYTAIKKIPDVRPLSPHCCRHTYVTRLQEKGVSLELIARLAGHSQITTTDHYAHTSIATLADTVSVLNNTTSSPVKENTNNV